MSHKGFGARRRRVPTIEKQTVLPRRPKNADVRPREFLTAEEVERLTAAAKKDTRRHTYRDATLILMAYRHGLRAASSSGCAGTCSTSSRAPSTSAAARTAE